MSDIPEKVYYACLRIDGKQFYGELRGLGFAPDDAAEVASWSKLIYEFKIEARTSAAFLSDKKSYAVKACLAYIRGKALNKPLYERFSMNKITLFSDKTNRNCHDNFSTPLHSSSNPTPIPHPRRSYSNI
jgi:hypothetical protein